MLRRTSIFILSLLMAACTFSPQMSSVSIQDMDSENKQVTVVLRSVDVKTIKRKEYYFSVVVAECNDKSKRYPAEAYIDGQPASNFEFPTSGGEVRITGEIPTRVLDRYIQPCVLLEGGRYFTGRLKTQMLTLNSR